MGKQGEPVGHWLMRERSHLGQWRL